MGKGSVFVRYFVVVMLVLFVACNIVADILDIFRVTKDLTVDSSTTHEKRTMTLFLMRSQTGKDNTYTSNSEFTLNSRCHLLHSLSRVLASTGLAGAGFGFAAFIVALIQTCCVNVKTPLNLALFLAFLCQVAVVVILCWAWFQGFCPEDDHAEWANLEPAAFLFNPHGGVNPMKETFHMVEGFALHCAAGLGYLLLMFVNIGA